MSDDQDLNQTNQIATPIQIEVKPNPTQKPRVKINYIKTYFEETQNIISDLQEKLATKIFVYYVPEKDMITQEHPDYFLELLRGMEHQEKISLILYSRGGDPMACVRIASILRKYCNSFEVILLSSCYSAATQLTLAADKIIFSLVGHLGPIDAQIVNIRDPRVNSYNYEQVSFSSFLRSYKLLESEGNYKTEDGQIETPYRTLFKYIHPLVYSEIDKLSTRSITTAEIMMKMHPQSFENEQKIKWIAHHLVYDYPCHDFLIRYEEAKEMGLPVEQINESVTFQLWDLLKLYRAATKNAVTNMGAGLTHTEENRVIIESLNKRVYKNFNYEDTYSSAEKRWRTVGTQSYWLKIIPSNSQDKKSHRIVLIQTDEEEEFKKNLENNPQNSPPIKPYDAKVE